MIKKIPGIINVYYRLVLNDKIKIEDVNESIREDVQNLLNNNNINKEDSNNEESPNL